jgi:impB/mucB/samB family protein
VRISRERDFTTCEHVFVLLEEVNILHADVDAFYASVEQRDDPHLRERPVIVEAGLSVEGIAAGRGLHAYEN